MPLLIRGNCWLRSRLMVNTKLELATALRAVPTPESCLLLSAEAKGLNIYTIDQLLSQVESFQEHGKFAHHVAALIHAHMRHVSFSKMASHSNLVRRHRWLASFLASFAVTPLPRNPM